MQKVKKGDTVIVKDKLKIKTQKTVRVQEVAESTFKDIYGSIYLIKNIIKICPIQVGDMITTDSGEEEEVIKIFTIYSYTIKSKNGIFVCKTNTNEYFLHDILSYKRAFQKGKFKYTKTFYM